MSPVEDPVAWAATQPADRVRRRVLHALALRAQAQAPGVLRDKLIEALKRRAAQPPTTPRLSKHHVPANPLPDLLELLRTEPGQELRHVRLHHSTWRRLRVAQSMPALHAAAPGSPGPLNGEVLARRALQQIQALAPDYLHRLLMQMDTISALEQLPAPAKPDKPTKTGLKKPAERRR